jgi:hypothetical protein
MRTRRCGGCGAELGEHPSTAAGDRQPCPACGSLDRSQEVCVSATLTHRSRLGLKAKSPDEKKPFMEQKVGDELFRKSRRRHRLLRVIDRRHGRYVEYIEDAETG